MASMDYGLGVGFEPKHVDRKSLYVSLEERIKYLHEFMEWSDADVDALRDGAKYLKQLIPEVTTMVYKKLIQRDITSRAFHIQTTAKEVDLDEEWLTENTPQIKRRKMFLRWYLIRLCQDPAKPDFWKYLARVGRMHSGQERLHPLNVEYIHISACLGYISDIFLEAVMGHPQLTTKKKMALMRALNKVVWIQNDLFAKWHVRDGEEFEDEISLSSFGSKDMHPGIETTLNSSANSIDDDQASIASSMAPSMQSTAPSTHTLHQIPTGQSVQTMYSSATQASVCPFASVAKSSSETKIWAD